MAADNDPQGQLALRDDPDLANLSSKDRAAALAERQGVIDECIDTIKRSFFRLGKALWEIKQYQLHRADPEYPQWSDYLRFRIAPHLHQSTISDYIAIVKMQTECSDFMHSDEISDLGYKKARLLKSKYQLAKKEPDPAQRRKLLGQFREAFNRLNGDLRGASFAQLNQVFDIEPPEPTPSADIRDELLGEISLRFNRDQGRIEIRSRDTPLLDQIYDSVRQKASVLQSDGDASREDRRRWMVQRFLQELPKVELHLHMEAMVQMDSIYELALKNKVDDSIRSLDDIYDRFHCNSLDTFLQSFFFVQSCYKEEKDFALMVKDAVTYCKRNNILHAEVYFAPSKFVNDLGMDFFKLMEIIEEQMEIANTHEGVSLRLLVDVSRMFGFENAMNNLQRVLDFNGKYIVGIGLGGAETVGPAKDFEGVFQRAKENGLHVVAHAGEDAGPESIEDAINFLGAERIGHAVAARQSQATRDLIREKQVGIEVCPTSNAILVFKYMDGYRDHPFRQFYDDGLLCSLNTDDPSIFGVELSDEYMKVHEVLDFSLEELMHVLHMGIDMSFLDTAEKERIRLNVAEASNSLRIKYNLEDDVPEAQIPKSSRRRKS